MSTNKREVPYARKPKALGKHETPSQIQKFPSLRRFEYDNRTEIVKTKGGGKQSRLDLRYDLVAARALRREAAVLHFGAERYGENQWQGIPLRDHINRAIYHLYEYLDVLDSGLEISREVKEDHLGHALCRVTFAVALDEDEARE